jgi:hypothetical protein
VFDSEVWLQILSFQMTCLCREEHELLEAVQARLVVYSLTAPVLGNDHNDFRSRENPVRKVETNFNVTSGKHRLFL